MLAKLNSVGLLGIDGYIVTVEVDVASGLPAFEIVGLPDATVKEAKDRIRSGIKNSGYVFPSKRIVINLSPASLRKEGGGYDLPMAVGVLVATGQVPQASEDTVVIGELSLDGTVNKVSGVLPMVISAFTKGYKNFYVPEANAKEAAVIEGANIYPVRNIGELCRHLKGDEEIEKVDIDRDSLFSDTEGTLLDFADVKGQETAKRALEIAAAGNHNVLIV